MQIHMDISLHYIVAFRTFFFPLPSVKKLKREKRDKNKTKQLIRGASMNKITSHKDKK